MGNQILINLVTSGNPQSWSQSCTHLNLLSSLPKRCTHSAPASHQQTNDFDNQLDKKIARDKQVHTGNSWQMSSQIWYYLLNLMFIGGGNSKTKNQGYEEIRRRMGTKGNRNSGLQGDLPILQARALFIFLQGAWCTRLIVYLASVLKIRTYHTVSCQLYTSANFP